MNNFIEGLITSVAPLWEEVGEGGGGAGDSGSGAGDSGSGAGGDWTPPEGLASDFVGASADESLGKLMEGYSNLNNRFEGVRTEMSKMPAAPKSADEYEFKASENTAPWFGDADKNPIMPLAREAAHKHGLSNEQFNGFINEVYGAAAEAGAILPPLDPAGEIKSYMTLSKGDEKTATSDFTANEAFAKGLRAQLTGLPEDENLRTEVDGLMMSMTDTAAGNFLLSALRTRMADSGLKIGGESANNEGGHFAKDDLRKMASDPRADPKSPKYEKDFRAKLTASYKYHYPEEAT